jgi:hypothetical protein
MEKAQSVQARRPLSVDDVRAWRGMLPVVDRLDEAGLLELIIDSESEA